MFLRGKVCDVIKTVLGYHARMHEMDVFLLCNH